MRSKTFLYGRAKNTTLTNVCMKENNWTMENKQFRLKVDFEHWTNSIISMSRILSTPLLQKDIVKQTYVNRWKLYLITGSKNVIIIGWRNLQFWQQDAQYLVVYCYRNDDKEMRAESCQSSMECVFPGGKNGCGVWSRWGSLTDILWYVSFNT